MPNAPVLDAAMLPWTARLEAEWPAIFAELRAVLAHREAVPPLNEISPDHGRIAADGKWQSFFLVGYGNRVHANMARAPQTTAAIETIPGLNSAFFSILAPGCHIPRHRGVTKGLLTCHLGLMVPEDAPSCRMNVGGTTVHWQAGRCLLFDDTYPHEVWNDTHETRVVLLIQFERPTAIIGRIVARLFLSGARRTAFVKDAIWNLGTWETIYRRSESCASQAARPPTEGTVDQ